jgi:hypothetical protein
VIAASAAFSSKSPGSISGRAESQASAWSARLEAARSPAPLPVKSESRLMTNNL